MSRMNVSNSNISKIQVFNHQIGAIRKRNYHGDNKVVE